MQYNNRHHWPPSSAELTGVASRLTTKRINHYSIDGTTVFDVVDFSTRHKRVVSPLGAMAVFDLRPTEIPQQRSNVSPRHPIIALSAALTTFDIATCYGSTASNIVRSIENYEGTINGVTIGLDDSGRLIASQVLQLPDNPDGNVNPDRIVDQMIDFGSATVAVTEKFLYLQ